MAARLVGPATKQSLRALGPSKGRDVRDRWPLAGGRLMLAAVILALLLAADDVEPPPAAKLLATADWAAFDPNSRFRANRHGVIRSGADLVKAAPTYGDRSAPAVDK